jgi:Active DUF488-N3 subclade
VMSQRDAERSAVPAALVNNISPYVNPAHVLAPPRRWLEALVSGAYSWQFVRLRYKSLLRTRHAAEPERFHALLDASEAGQELVMTCHCATERCHRVLAREFLERLRSERPQPASKPAARPQPARRMPPAREWAHSPSPNLVLATLIEHPHGAQAAQH